jgi:hypothetical protein
MKNRSTAVRALLFAGVLLGASHASGQEPLAATAPPLYQVEIVVFRQGGGADGAPGPTVVPGTPAPVAATDLRLGGVVRRLTTTGYQPLLHAGWRQPVTPRLQAFTANASRPPASVTATVYQQGGLLLEIDATIAGVGPPADSGEPGIVRLRATRRIGNGNLHYFDHPDFGVIAAVRPVVAAGSE